MVATAVTAFAAAAMSSELLGRGQPAHSSTAQLRSLWENGMSQWRLAAAGTASTVITGALLPVIPAVLVAIALHAPIWAAPVVTMSMALGSAVGPLLLGSGATNSDETADVSVAAALVSVVCALPAPALLIAGSGAVAAAAPAVPLILIGVCISCFLIRIQSLS
jgi:hypothetical protein